MLTLLFCIFQYKTGFEEEVDQPFSINSPETKPILKILSICFGSLAVCGYIGITIINCIKGKKKKPEFDKVAGNYIVTRSRDQGEHTRRYDRGRGGDEGGQTRKAAYNVK